jgi:hypothetical protein
MMVSIQTPLVVAAVIFLALMVTSRRPDGAPNSLSINARPVGSQSIVSETVPIYRDTYNKTALERDLLGMIRYHYDATKSSCDNVLLLGVGTFMSVMDYDKISATIASGQSIIVIIADHNLHHVEKTSPERYAMLTIGVMNQLSRLLPVCREIAGDDSTLQLLIGGHSASGQAALQAWQQGMLSKVSHKVAFLGLDPYEISNTTIDQQIGLVIPSLYWGFTKTTCLVRTDMAARAAYEVTKDSRVLYVIDNAGDGCAMTHCVFTDQGCGFRPFACSTKTKIEWVYDAVAESVGLFLQCLSGALPFDHSHFELSTPLAGDVQVYVNEEHQQAREDLKQIVVTHQSNSS